jgi:tRNA threonylcarbamoyl adenosine modification protein YeaZ
METILRVGAEGATEEFAPVVRSTLQEAGITLADVEEIAVSAGPGSYMGVRAAVATANAFAFATGLTVTSVDSLHAVASAVDHGDRLTVALPAGRGRYFVASYERTATGLARENPPELLDQFTPTDEYVVATPPVHDAPTEEASSGAVVLSSLSVLCVLERRPSCHRQSSDAPHDDGTTMAFAKGSSLVVRRAVARLAGRQFV